jgi:predicted esterase
MKIGETVSHYRVIELLGAGGMGVVYKAEDTRLKRPVALKFLAFGLVQDREAKERLVHEAQAASALDHPNICTIHEIDETSDGQLFLAMAYYEGETLKERIARGPLTVDEALDFITQIARGVATAHEAGIIHRDIKPANIILTRRGELKLLDFGLAKLTGQTTLTRTGTTLGTVAYMPPEQIAGRGVDERSDVWALGIVFYEMLTGQRPFRGDHEVAVIQAIAHDPPRPLRDLRRETPAEFEPIVARALQKEPKDRYASARAFLQDVEALRTFRASTANIPAGHQPAARGASRRLLIVAAAALAVVAALGSWFAVRSIRTRNAKRALPEVADLIRREEYTTAFHRIHELDPVLGGDRDFLELKRSFLFPASVRTTPPGADVYVRGYLDNGAEWIYLGQSPIDMRGPIGQFRWRITKTGFTPYEGAHGMDGEPMTLAVEGSLPEGMVRVPGGAVQLPDRVVILEDFFIDRYEVTNRDFKKFIDAGGYRNQAYWQEPFVKDGHPVAYDEAMREFRDATGTPGPSTWELGHYPDGQDDYPVSGVSWYEAAAYARFAGKQLPTVHHWRKAANTAANSLYSEILTASNFKGRGSAKVGRYQGVGPYGTYDMAGNVKEWCSNAVRDKRYILGGAWNEPPYVFRQGDALAPFDRGPGNGFRCIKLTGSAPLQSSATDPIERFERDYSQEKPVSDDVFRIYKDLYSYDHADLQPTIESTDDTSPFWRVERISYAATYGNERIIAHLFLPKNAKPPYQTVVYFPSAAALSLRSFEEAELSYLGFAVKSGRALLLPMYKGTYERRLASPPAGPNGQRDLTIAQIKDVRRSVDYLETRKDIDRSKVAYFGVSFGATLAPIPLAVENRFKTAVLWSGGFPLSPRLPEVDDINFAPRVTIPVLMLNGRDDFIFPVKASQIPMFQALGTPSQNKRSVLYDGGHIFPFARVEKDTLEWLDTYFGPTQQ